ncbi:MAG: DMT family transporter [Verrucomicrobia bacterium]|nr:DMT family transporter [Verrucomicrobiota bacterium]
MFLFLLGLALYPLSDLLVQHLMQLYSVEQTTFLRAFLRLIPLLLAGIGSYGQIFRPKNPVGHLTRLLVSIAYSLSFMYAISIGSLTVVYTFSYTSSIFMIILSALLLKEKVSRKSWLAVAVGLFGVLVAIQPGAHLFEWVALFVLLGSFLGALNKILMRRLSETEHNLSITIYPNILMVLVMAPLVLTNWQSMPWEHWGLFAIVGIITAAAQYAIAASLKSTEASVLAPFEYSTFFWVAGLDYFWWSKTPDLSTIIGASIIVASNLYILRAFKAPQRT